MEVMCSRCNTFITGSDSSDHLQGFTCGYYDLSGGNWKDFARQGEVYICDTCMFSDPKYIAIYGDYRTNGK